MSLTRLEPLQRATPLRCPYCRDDLSQKQVPCLSCGAVYHPACRAELGGCATLGCVGDERERPSADELLAALRARPLETRRAAHPQPASGFVEHTRDAAPRRAVAGRRRERSPQVDSLRPLLLVAVVVPWAAARIELPRELQVLGLFLGTVIVAALIWRYAMRDCLVGGRQG